MERIQDVIGSHAELGRNTRMGFVIPAVRQGKQVMAWGVIGYNYKGPLYRFDLEACTPPLRYHLQRPFRETPANGINCPKYAERIIRGPLIEAVRTFTNQEAAYSHGGQVARP